MTTLVITSAGCLTPSIPIPPPDPSLMTFAITPASGVASFSYPATQNYIGSVVYVFNRDKGAGVIETARPDGSVGAPAPLPAAVGDAVVITFEHVDQTVSTCIRLRDGTQSSTDYCP
jgi:hypothetical protein